jgi:mono/diheme cytochrome c family protein
MPRRTLPLLLLALACCTASEPPAPPPPSSSTTAAAEPPASWKRAMTAIGRHHEVIDKGLKARPPTNLRAVAAAAEDAAALMQHGYGKLVDARIPGFAGYARGAEAWLLQIALEARQDRPDSAAALFAEGEAQHCGKCHEASKPFFAW